MNYIQIAKDTINIEIDELKSLSNRLSNEITDTIELISQCKGKLIITGVGKSGLIGSKIAATLASTGTSSFFLHPTEAMHGDLGMIGKDDMVLAISYSGESEELIQILPHLKRFDIPLIAMAKSKDSTLGVYSDIFLDISISKEACPLGVAPTSSTTVTLALGDAIAVALMKKRDFQKEDFASFHPGGSLGKKLFIKVSDLIQKENLPIIYKDTKIKDAIVIMSEGRLGNAIILDNSNKVCGLLSDGDLRRAMLKDSFSLDELAYNISTKSPKYIDNIDILASDALKIIEDFKIQLLLVVNKDNSLVGIVHIHKLVEIGIKRD
jgi:arabinose-5-phosphate isomerase